MRRRRVAHQGAGIRILAPEAAGSSLGQVLKTTVFLKDLNDFRKMNEVYARYFPEHPPARATIEAARLPLDTLVEIEAIASAG